MRHGVLRHGVLPIFTYGAFHLCPRPESCGGGINGGFFSQTLGHSDHRHSEKIWLGRRGAGWGRGAREFVAATVRTTYYYSYRCGRIISTLWSAPPSTLKYDVIFLKWPRHNLSQQHRSRLSTLHPVHVSIYFPHYLTLMNGACSKQ